MANERGRRPTGCLLIERIEKYAVRGRQALATEELLQAWVVHHLMIIGEACRALSGDFRTKHLAGAPAATLKLSYYSARTRRKASSSSAIRADGSDPTSLSAPLPESRNRAGSKERN